MKVLHQKLCIALVAIFEIAACGNAGTSGNNVSEEAMREINTEANFRDTVKPKQSIKFDFENLETGNLPSGWSQFFTGVGGTDWKITDDNGNKVLGQLYTSNPNSHFNIVVNDTVNAKDVMLTVRLKGVSGRHDQGGGFVWRFIDKENYYIVRANPLEDNVVMYKVENGKRTDLPLVGKGKTYGVDVDKLGKGWNTLKIIVRSDLFTVYLNEKELFKVQDKTFTNSGKAGLWTKADAVTYFDDFEIQHYE